MQARRRITLDDDGVSTCDGQPSVRRMLKWILCSRTRVDGRRNVVIVVGLDTSHVSWRSQCVIAMDNTMSNPGTGVEDAESPAVV